MEHPRCPEDHDFKVSVDKRAGGSELVDGPIPIVVIIVTEVLQEKGEWTMMRAGLQCLQQQDYKAAGANTMTTTVACTRQAVLAL